MDKFDQKLLDNLRLNISDINRKEEIFLLDEFINRYNSDQQYNDENYSEMFKILLNLRLKITINETYL